MSWLKDLRGAMKGLAQLRNLENPETPLSSEAVSQHFDVNHATTGVAVTEERAMGVASIYAGVRVLAESVASLPLEVYERTGANARQRLRDHPSYEVLHRRPNPFMSAFNYWELAIKQLVMRGNHYAELVFDTNGYVVGLWPLVPEHTRPVITGRDALVYVTNIAGERVGLPAWRVLHFSALGNGVEGRGVLHYARETIGYAAALDEYQGRFFSNGAHPSGFLRYAGQRTLSKEARDRIKTAWQMSHGGLSNAHRTAVFEENLEWVRTSVSPEEAQALESRKLTRSELAGILRVPAHFINDLERATFSNIEHLSLDFVMHSLRPWLVRTEQELNYKLFKGEPDVFCEFNVDGMLRGDKKTRAEALAIERQHGIITPNEWRAIENKNPIDNTYGDSFTMPLNTAMVGPDGTMTPAKSDAGRDLTPVVADAARRLVRGECRAVRRLLRKAEAQRGGEELRALVEEYYSDTSWAEAIVAPLRAVGVDLSADEWMARSRRELAACATAEEVEQRLAEWERTRVVEVEHAVSE